MHGELRTTYKILVRKRQEKTPLGRSRCGWEDIINMDKRQEWCKGLEYAELTQD
jgi:hypothetical protein